MRFLLSSTHGTGHVLPILPFARALRARGHDVLLAGPPPIAEHAARERLRYAPLPWPDEERLAAVRRLVAVRRGMPRLQTAVSDLFVGTYAAAALPAMLALVADFKPDAILHETAESSAAIAGDALGVPTFRVGVALATPSEAWWLRIAAGALDDLRAGAGLKLDPGARRLAETTLLTQTPAALDAFQGPAPSNVLRFRNPGGDGGAAGADLVNGYDWPDPDAPLVPISFGTMVPVDGHYPSLYRAAIDAISALPVRVLVTVGRRADPAALGELPANVRAEQWLPLADVLPHASAFAMHGGTGTTLLALAAGVPMAVLPISADQPLNARLIERFGAGLALDGGAQQAPGLGGLVTRLLEDDDYAGAARSLAREMAGLPPISAAVAEIERQALDAHPWTVGTTISSATFTRGGAATA